MDLSQQLIGQTRKQGRPREFPDTEEVCPCQPRARTGRKPETLTGTRTTPKPGLTSIAAVESRPGIDMVRKRSRGEPPGAATPDPSANGLSPPLFQPLTAYAARGRIFPAPAWGDLPSRKPICKRDATRPAETEEMQVNVDNYLLHSPPRPGGTPETGRDAQRQMCDAS
jgi:hypothetical protein